MIITRRGIVSSSTVRALPWLGNRTRSKSLEKMTQTRKPKYEVVEG